MIPSPQLITALRRAADRIEDPNTYYRWASSGNCNCGILARECLNISADTLKDYGINLAWTHMVEHLEENACSRTGIPYAPLFDALESFGLELKDFRHIELTDSHEVIARMGVKRYVGCFEEPRFVACYFRAQADMLEEQLTPPAPKVQQPCCHMWLECGVCMICSATKPIEIPVTL